ncbi:PorP/SprF family type IX secretion system membrane protein [Hufsiella ginkgonis]|uniref:Type IX secretion system membrane protein PorP/SprF n=1 Tax=Hufsiella ginkgonis TaxID=2695274 RepID=A0A7K1Y3P3_9SPHI|nr:PorP/SprF family type IX secretion system membrane protein [Hufsiella ginkgonis]MXV17880.1 type IX secretion system membrane protein PorP/SprF [Hufsiella ginkgonis]
MKTFKIITLVLSLCCFSATAQIDPHFSQYYSFPMWLNPALTGVIDGDYRASLNAKSQWNSIANPYSTFGASFDKAPAKNLAFGATVINQASGDISFNHLNALVSASYRLRFGQLGYNMLNFGLQAGVVNRSFNPNGITVGSQNIPGTGYDGSVAPDETFSNSSSLMPDVNAGLFYFDGNPDMNINPFAGISASHLTRPVDKFLSSNERIPIRYTAHGGVRIKVNETLDLTPNGLYMRQGSARESMVGVYGRVMLQNDSDLLLGSSFRFNDSAIGFAGFHIKNFIFGVSYDFNTSTLQRASDGRGGLEFSLSFTRRGSIVGPNFFCPRL